MTHDPHTRVPQGVEGEVTASAASPDGSTLALGSDDGIVSVVRLADLQVVSSIRVEESAVTCVKFAATGEDVVCVHASGRAVLWRWRRERPTGVFSVRGGGGGGVGVWRVKCDV